MVLDNGVGVVEVAGVHVHLGAAGLPGRVYHLVPQTFKDFDGRTCHARIHAVYNAC